IMSAYPPCQEVVLKHHLGILFDSENVDDLRIALFSMHNDIKYFDRIAKYDECISEIPTWDELSKIFFE
ncbi:MAG: hypothetical protein ACHQEM_12815, partial [Chitinophagales bacterium]